MNKKYEVAVLVIGIVCVVLSLIVVIFNFTRPIAGEVNSKLPDSASLESVGYREIKPASAIVVETVESDEPFFYLSEYERNVVEKIVAGEARGESLKGQMLVAQCILDACLLDDLQPSQVRTKYGYGGWSNDVTDSVKKAVSEVFDNGELAVQAPILYFYNPKYRSSWHESQRFIIEEGNHRFFAGW